MSSSNEQPPSKIQKTVDIEVKRGTVDVHTSAAEVFMKQDLENGHFDASFEIEGQILHANKFVLCCNSATFRTMLSDRWSMGDAPIKIQRYSFNDFKEFVYFLYTGEYRLTRENILPMIDMAEYYGIASLKEACNQNIHFESYRLKDGFVMFDAAKKYSLEKARVFMASFIKDVLFALFKCPQISKASMLELIEHETSDEVFESAFRWAVFRNQDKPWNNNAAFKEAIKGELADIIQHMNLNHFSPDFVNNFMILKKFVFNEADWTKIKDSLKFPLVILSYPADRQYKLMGRIFVDNEVIIEKIRKLRTHGTNVLPDRIGYHWNGRVKFPLTARKMAKKSDASYYFVINRTNGHLSIKTKNNVRNDYLLGEMYGRWDASIEKDMIITIA